jgi:hypothetical protein
MPAIPRAWKSQTALLCPLAPPITG